MFSIPNLQALSHLTLTFISTLVQDHTANQEFIFLNKTLFPDSSKFRARKVFKSVEGKEHRSNAPGSFKGLGRKTAEIWG